MSKPRAAIVPLFFALTALAPSALPATDLRVDDLELLSHGEYDQSSASFDVSSRLFFALSMEGGAKSPASSSWTS